MSLLSLVGAGRDAGLRTLFHDLDLHVGPGERLGLIGPNGAGKSTLLRVLAGREPLDRGERRCSPRLRVVLLDQAPDPDPHHTVLEEVGAGGGERMALLRRHGQLGRELADHPDDPRRLAELGALHQRLDATDAWGLESRCREVLERLGLGAAAAADQPMATLSGGQRRRVALAAALVAEPDVLLLDEPTNHLDADGVEWLQGYLARFPGAVVLVTHDRYLLDRVTSRIVAVEGGEARRYDGNYAAYLERRAAEEEAEAAGAAQLRNTLRRELAWLRRGPKARSTKQKARLARIAALQEIPVRRGRGTVRLAVTEQRLGRRVISAEGLGMRAPGGEAEQGRQLLSDFTHDFGPEDRVGIIGPNGVGKSSLLEVIAGRRSPDAGRLELGATVRLAYFDQHSEVLLAGQGERKVIDVVREVASRVRVEGSELEASQLLERFLFPPAQQHQPLARLSGGERRRLHLCRLLMGAPNVLLLDEPTNDLDVHTLGVLEEFLDDFRGCVVVVSHDRWFLDRTVDRLFAFEDGRLRRYEGNYSTYLEQRARAEERQRASAAPAPRAGSGPGGAAGGAPPPPAGGGEKPRRRSFRESRELEAIERDLPAWEERRRELETLLGSPACGNHTRLEALTRELADLVERIEAAEERWLALSELAA